MGYRPPRPPNSDYEVGYAKPPKATQFKKGQSGNPKGRPKGARDLATVLTEEMGRKAKVRDGDRTIMVPMIEVMVRTLMSNAAKGDPRAVDRILELTQRCGIEFTPPRAERALSSADALMFDIMIRDLAANPTSWSPGLGNENPDPILRRDEVDDD